MVEVENNIQKHPAYKDYRVVWLGEIPEHWKIKPGFTILSESKRKNTGFVEKTVLSLSYGNVVIKPEEKLTGLVPESFETYQLVEPGDIIIRPTDLQNDKTSLRTGLAKNKGIITSAYINLRVNKKYSNSFYHYYLYIIDLNKVIYGLGSGLRQNISFWDFKRFPFPFPPSQEQTGIAQFLDDKTTKIEDAIAIKEQQINLLKERKQILIHKAVTQGLNSNATLKDSGVEWIGAIPEHWEVKRLASFGKFSKGGGFSKADLVENGVSAILYGDIYTKYNISIKKEVRFISVETAKKSIKIDKHDLLFTGSGETKEDIGKCVVFLNDKIAYAGGDVIIFKQTENDSLFLSFTLNTEGAKFEKARYSKGEIIVHTYGSKLRNIYIPIPSPTEQIEISAYIESASYKIETAISLKQQEIAKLKEYKSSLINSAVTGKIKVS